MTFCKVAAAVTQAEHQWAQANEEQDTWGLTGAAGIAMPMADALSAFFSTALCPNISRALDAVPEVPAFSNDSQLLQHIMITGVCCQLCSLQVAKNYL